MLSKLEIIQQKICTLPQLIPVVYQWKMLAKKVVFTNGCFDILHKGHITYLLQAAQYGNKMIVAINSDESVKKIKGATRPIIDQHSRALMLAAQTYIDAVIIFDEETPIQLINTVKPHVLIKGGDYKLTDVVGVDEVKAAGGEVILIPFIEGFSTSAIIEKIKEMK